MSICSGGAVRTFALAGLLLTAGCADRFLYTPVKPPPRPMSPRPGAAVEVLVVTPPARPHTDVGLIQAFAGANRWDESVQEMIGNLRERAGSLGCDAILITSIERWVSPHHSQTIQASCVVYDEAAPTSPPCR